MNLQERMKNVSVTNFNRDNGLDTQTLLLETLHFKNKNVSAYLAYGKFELFKCTSDMGIKDHLNEIERLCDEIHRYQMTLPSTVLAYRVLNWQETPYLNYIMTI